MKLHNRRKGDRVCIRERIEADGKTKVNVYELVIRLGKGKKKAVMQRSRIEAALSGTEAEDTARLEWLIKNSAAVDASNSSAEDGEPFVCSAKKYFGFGATARDAIDDARRRAQ